MAHSIRSLTAVALALSLGACAAKPDFGRTGRHELSFVEDAARYLDRQTQDRAELPELPMSNGEQEMRLLLSLFEEDPLATRNVISGTGRETDVPDYYAALRVRHADSGSSLLNEFGNRLLKDRALLEQFARTSVDVTAGDAQRLGVVRDAMAEDRAAFTDAVDVLLLVEDNGRVMDRMVDLVDVRIAAYRLSLQRAALDMPDGQKIGAIEEALEHLERSAAGVRGDAIQHRAVQGELFGRQVAEQAI